MTTVTELKKLFIELGGNPEDLKGCQTDADVIKLLSEVVGSTIELPAVSASDNGKVLKVIEGAWGKGADEALPEVTAEDNDSVLSVVDGAWAKTSFRLKVIDIEGTTDSNGIIYDNFKLINYKKDIGSGNNVLILGAKITNELDFFDANIATVFCDVTYDKFIGGNNVTSYATSGVSIRCKTLSGGSEAALANKSVKVRVAYLEFKTE